MKSRTFKTLEGGVYSVRIQNEDWSQADLNLMEKHGEPEIDLGGTFGTGEGEYELDTHLVRINTQSPFTAKFDIRDNEDAATRAEVWKTEIISRLTSAITTLRALDDGFSGEEVQQI